MSIYILRMDQDIKVIDFVLKIRAAASVDKINILNQSSAAEFNDAHQRFWSFSETDLQEMRLRLVEARELFLTQVDISSITI